GHQSARRVPGAEPEQQSAVAGERVAERCACHIRRTPRSKQRYVGEQRTVQGQDPFGSRRSARWYHRASERDAAARIVKVRCGDKPAAQSPEFGQCQLQWTAVALAAGG